MTTATPKVGDRAPDFSLRDAAGQHVTLQELLGRGAVVLYFYPQDETWGCTVEACAFRDSFSDFVDAGATVVGVSRDDQASHARFAAKHRLPFTLLSDPTGAVHELYGIGGGRLLKQRVTFVIDREGVVRHAFESRVRFRAHVTRALEVVRELTESSRAPTSPSFAPSSP